MQGKDKKEKKLTRKKVVISADKATILSVLMDEIHGYINVIKDIEENPKKTKMNERQKLVFIRELKKYLAKAQTETDKILNQSDYHEDITWQ